MILMRLEGLAGKYCDVSGGRDDEYDYSSDNAGWFPIESMNFGVQEKSKGRNKQNAPAGKAGSAPRVATPAATGAAQESEDNDTFSRIQISKLVDLASPSLMKFAMDDRKINKGEAPMRKADFHFLHSVMAGSNQGESTTIFPYLLITLEDVVIESWGIQAGADDRPSESFSLKYDKAAMRYYRTKDGKIWIGGDVAGWDQHKDAEWSDPSSRYFREPKSR